MKNKPPFFNFKFLKFHFIFIIEVLVICVCLGSNLISDISVIFAEDGLIAVVNNEAITQKDLDEFINFMRLQMLVQFSEQETEQRINRMLPDLIDRLVEDQLILQAARKEGIVIEPNRIKARIGQIRQSYSGGVDFEDALAAKGLNLADIELKIEDQLLMAAIIEREVQNKVVVKPQEITDYYSAHRDDFNKPEQRLVRFLIIASSIASEVEASMAEYEDLDALTKAYSLQISDLGWIGSKQLKKEIADMVFSLELGGLSPFLNSDKSIYVFEVKDIKPAKKLTLFEAQKEINRFLFEKKMHQAAVEWLEKLRSQAYIEIKNNNSN